MSLVSQSIDSDPDANLTYQVEYGLTTKRDKDVMKSFNLECAHFLNAAELPNNPQQHGSDHLNVFCPQPLRDIRWVFPVDDGDGANKKVFFIYG